MACSTSADLQLFFAGHLVYWTSNREFMQDFWKKLLEEVWLEGK
jgi:hypothetical protein